MKPFISPTIPTVATLTAATIGLAIGWAIIGPTPDPRTTSPAAQTVAQLQEDDPGFDCYEQGNRVCGDPDQVHATEAWKAWDAGQAWRRLRAASTDTRVEYVGTAMLPPSVDALTEVAVPAIDGIWYVFRAEPAAPAMAPCADSFALPVMICITAPTTTTTSAKG